MTTRKLLRVAVCGMMTAAVPSLATAGEGEPAIRAARQPTTMRVGVMLVPTPMGNLRDGPPGSEVRVGSDPTVGAMATFDFLTRANLFVGFAPSYIFHVKARANYDVVSSHDFDLLVRLGYALPVGDRFHAYGYLAPGYSFISGFNSNVTGQGPVLGVHAGGLYDLTPGFFFAAEVGYQAGFQRTTSEPVEASLAASFIQIGLGVGAHI